MGTRGRSHHSAAHLVSRALLALTGLVALSLAACTATGSQGPGLAQSQVLSWAYVNATAVKNPKWDVAVLDPAVITNAIDSSNIAMIYTGLVTLNSSTLQIEPDAAQSISVSPDGKEYTFQLKPNLFFSDGSPITAQTFAYSIDRAIGPTTQSGQSLLCTIDDSQSYGATNNCASPGAYYLGLIDGAAYKTGLTPLARIHVQSYWLLQCHPWIGRRRRPYVENLHLPSCHVLPRCPGLSHVVPGRAESYPEVSQRPVGEPSGRRWLLRAIQGKNV